VNAYIDPGATRSPERVSRPEPQRQRRRCFKKCLLIGFDKGRFHKKGSPKSLSPDSGDPATKPVLPRTGLAFFQGPSLLAVMRVLVTSDPSAERLGISAGCHSTPHALIHFMTCFGEAAGDLNLIDPENGAGLRDREVLHVAQKENFPVLWTQFKSGQHNPLKCYRLEDRLQVRTFCTHIPGVPPPLGSLGRLKRVIAQS